MEKTDWWTWPLMIFLSPIYVLMWLLLILICVLALIIGIFAAGWEKAFSG